MCGELDDDEDAGQKLETHLYESFLAHARRLLAESARTKLEPGSRAAYADRLFTDALTRCSRDCERLDPAERYETLAMQPLVFARLAGFLASHLALNEDPMRKMMEAMMHGYTEAEQLAPDHGHYHDDETGYDHQH
jgi:hypothetical protein